MDQPVDTEPPKPPPGSNSCGTQNTDERGNPCGDGNFQGVEDADAIKGKKALIAAIGEEALRTVPGQIVADIVVDSAMTLFGARAIEALGAGARAAARVGVKSAKAGAGLAKQIAGKARSRLGRGRLAPRERLAGAGGKWKTINETPGGAVAQQNNVSCGAACGEMLTGIEQAQVIQRAGAPTSAGRLGQTLGRQGGYVGPEQLDALLGRGPFAAHLYEGGGMGHFVVIDGVDDVGRMMVRDPWGGGSSYLMSRDEFLRVWNGEAVF